eukprot:476245-Prymnesium_polylepis.1
MRDAWPVSHQQGRNARLCRVRGERPVPATTAWPGRHGVLGALVGAARDAVRAARVGGAAREQPAAVQH